MQACVDGGREDNNPAEESDNTGDNASGAKVKAAALAHQQHLDKPTKLLSLVFCLKINKKRCVESQSFLLMAAER